MKCTPPRKSRPRYMGEACKAVSQAGERDTRFSATTNWGSAASGIRAFWMASLALSCWSVLSKRARIEAPSSARLWGVVPAALSASSTFCKVDVSTLMVALPEDTCTAGASPKKLGRV
jgi:hypothetical protein